MLLLSQPAVRLPRLMFLLHGVIDVVAVPLKVVFDILTIVVSLRGGFENSVAVVITHDESINLHNL